MSAIIRGQGIERTDIDTVFRKISFTHRDAEALDRERYQTVYARVPGAVAAPTAGLHFSTGLLAALSAKGVTRAAVTLHVGVGTFRPVEVDDPAEHELHHEMHKMASAPFANRRATPRNSVADRSCRWTRGNATSVTSLGTWHATAQTKTRARRQT